MRVCRDGYVALLLYPSPAGVAIRAGAQRMRDPRLQKFGDLAEQAVQLYWLGVIVIATGLAGLLLITSPCVS